MKFGLLTHKNCLNIGDDIQSFAIENLLPQIDYFVDREDLPNFRPENDEPVAVLMCAWYMWKKWNWPPCKYIVPKLMSMHYADHQIAKQPGSPAKFEFWTGIGADYLKAYGPVGCRDTFTLNKLKEIGVDAYFSGCITLTLPKMAIVKPEKEYICAVDIQKIPGAVEKLREIVKDTGIEVKVITHNKDRRAPELSWNEARKSTESLLTLYQNAKCVVTTRLHCALPCLAMEVPVLLVNNCSDAGKIRFDPYYDWLTRVSRPDFVNGDFDYDFTNPPANNTGYVETRENLIRMAKEFVEEYKDKDGSVDDYVKTTYTEDEVVRWQNKEMRNTLDSWLLQERQNAEKLKADRKKVATKERKLAIKEEKMIAVKKELKDKKAELALNKTENDKLKKDLEAVKKEKDRYYRILNCRSVKTTVKVRNAFCGKSKKIKY